MSTLALLGGTPVRTRPFPAWPRPTDVDRRRVREVLDSGNWGGYPFPNTFARELASRFAAHQGAAYGCCVSNGTVAITIALRAAGIRFGDEVILPAYTWDGTATAVLDAGAIPVFADVDPETYCLSVDAARAAITPRTRALLPVHLAMRFADMTALRVLAHDRGLVVVEDCAHAHGGAFLDEGAGSMGDLGTFSFQSSKLMSSGEGGIILTSRLDCLELVESLVNCGRASETDRFGQRMAGGNYRITEFQAALLLGQLEQLPELASVRAANAALLSEGLRSIPGVRPPAEDPRISRPTLYQYVFRYLDEANGVSRDLFAAALDAEGIPADGRFYEPVYRSDLFRVNSRDFPQLEGIRYDDVRCPESERAAYQESVWLPHFLLLGSERDTVDIVTAVSKIIAGRDSLRKTDPSLAGIKSMSRAERPRVEIARNY